jgi:hypothetical protein
MQKLELHINAVQDLEQQLGIQERWTATHPEYQKTLTYINNRTFIRAVEKLEGLVVQQLMELSKANVLGTGKCYSRCHLCVTANILFQAIRCASIYPRQS